MSNDHDWLNLVEVSGPFLAVPVLKDVFPQGLEALSSGHPQRLRRTYEEWREAVEVQDVDLTELHAAWVKEVLSTALEIDDAVLRSDDTLPASLTMMMPEHGTTITPDLAVVNPTNADEPLLLIHVYAPDTNLEATHRFGGLAITPADRMVSLLRATGCPIGLVTNGERWMLVHAPVGAVAGFASWYARLWGQEPETLRAFVSLLGVRRFFGPEDGRLTALYERSLKHQDDVTEALGEQVRRAVEVLVQSLDRANQDRNQELLRDVDPRELYEASLTVMMRLVFLLAAEERRLLLLGDPRYDSFYAISSLRMQLRSDSEEILERRRSAWSRLLGLFRGVFGGIEHPTLRLPALGGSLFDPDRYPFLEGRKKGTFWRTDPAEPLPIDDRTVLLLLEAIQTFQGRALSYRALDVEQIGHVYEGLLERTVKRVGDVTLELDGGSKAKSPRITLGEMESARLDGTARVVELLKERSERSEPAIRNALERQVDDRVAARLLTVCRGDVALRDRILPLANLLRTDPWGYPLVHHKGAFVVVLGADRRESGTHYTPKSLTEKIVEETLTPVAYRGPAEGKPPQKWELKSAAELLDLKVCDPAMGSGAFLVQACRWLSDRLVEAWSITEASGGKIDSEGRISGDDSAEGFDPLSPDAEERSIVARRLVAERCLYGVDRNPLAVELTKLSLWLTTMSKGRPFGFLDHNLRSGDSLLGIHDIRQLVELDMAPKESKQLRLFGRSIEAAVDEAVALRMHLRALPIRDIGDVDAMAALDANSRAIVRTPQLVADSLVAIFAFEPNASKRSARLEALAAFADAATNGEDAACERLLSDAREELQIEIDVRSNSPSFHWPLEFPEVFCGSNAGFNAIIGNPPFLGNRLWKSASANRLTEIVKMNLGKAPGKIDLSVVFHRRAAALLCRDGAYGLLASTSITEGSSVTAGLAHLVKNGAIFAANKNLPWPGSASISIAIVLFYKGKWSASCLADGVVCKKISARLECDSSQEDRIEPEFITDPLFTFEGVNNSKGLEFLLNKNSDWFSDLRSETKSLLVPYLSGDDITSAPLTSPKRWCLDIEDRELKELEENWPIASRFLNEVVSPTRTEEALKSYKGLHARWWQFWNHRADQMRRLRKSKRCFVFPKVAMQLQGAVSTTASVFTNKVLVVGLEKPFSEALLLSSLFRVWMEEFCSGTLGRVSCYTLTVKAVQMMPQPIYEIPTTAVEASRRLSNLVSDWCVEQNVGVRALHSELINEASQDEKIEEMRGLLREVNKEVFLAYGMEITDCNYGIYTDKIGSRYFGIDRSLHDLILRKLLEMNRSQKKKK